MRSRQAALRAAIVDEVFDPYPEAETSPPAQHLLPFRPPSEIIETPDGYRTNLKRAVEMEASRIMQTIATSDSGKVEVRTVGEQPGNHRWQDLFENKITFDARRVTKHGPSQRYWRDCSSRWMASRLKPDCSSASSVNFSLTRLSTAYHYPNPSQSGGSAGSTTNLRRHAAACPVTTNLRLPQQPLITGRCCWWIELLHVLFSYMAIRKTWYSCSAIDNGLGTVTSLKHFFPTYRLDIYTWKKVYAHGLDIRQDPVSPQRQDPGCPHFNYPSCLSHPAHADTILACPNTLQSDHFLSPPSPQRSSHLQTKEDISFIDSKTRVIGNMVPYLNDNMPLHEACIRADIGRMVSADCSSG